MTFGKLAARAAHIGVLAGISTFAQEISTLPDKAPPPSFPKLEGASGTPQRASAPLTASAAVQYSVGDPSDEAQLYLELINRARKNPSAEATRLINITDPIIQSAYHQPGNPVDLVLMASQFSIYSPAQPLSFNSKLTAAAQGHTMYMFNTGVQEHDEPNGFTLGPRVQAQGYAFHYVGENIYAYAKYVEYGHAGFEVDWGGSPATGGMQSPPGHRNSIHDGDFAEVGIFVYHGTNTVGSNATVGPQLVTQDFGTPATATTFITGVAYFDWNGNSFYDVGEGIGTVKVTVDGVNTYAVTSFSGAYSIPVPANQTYTVRFNLGGVETTSSVTVGTSSVKLDYTPRAVSTAVTASPSITFAGVPNLFQLAPLRGATGYRAQTRSLQVAATEGAENGTANVDLATTGGYPVFSTTVKATGAKSFHLAHVTDATTHGAFPQYVTFKNPFFVKAGGKIDFKSRYGFAYLGETARVEISADEGATWTGLYSQAGRDETAQPELTFSAKSVDLSAYAGKFVEVRFNYDVNLAVGWFDYESDNDGWYIDDIAFTNMDQVASTTLSAVSPSAAFPYVPPAPGNYQAQFQAMIGNRIYPFGPTFSVTAQANPPVFTFAAGNTTVTGGVVKMKFTKTAGTTTPVVVVSAPDLSGPWTVESGATITGPTNNDYQVSVATNGGARFYRVMAN